MTIETTPYPAYGGPHAAAVLRLRAEVYRGAAEELRAELDATERYFTAAFERVDESSSTRDRIRDLAKRPTRRIGA